MPRDRAFTKKALFFALFQLLPTSGLFFPPPSLSQSIGLIKGRVVIISLNEMRMNAWAWAGLFV